MINILKSPNILVSVVIGLIIVYGIAQHEYLLYLFEKACASVTGFLFFVFILKLITNLEHIERNRCKTKN